MFIEETKNKMKQLRLSGMLTAYDALIDSKANSDMSIDEYWINFIIDKIEPNGTAEIKYRIKNQTGKELDYSKIEPFIFTWVITYQIRNSNQLN